MVKKEKYILRTATLDKNKNKIIADTFYFFEDYKIMLEKIEKVTPDYYECFDSFDITKEVNKDLEMALDQKLNIERRKLYENLKKEFEQS